MVVEVGGDVAGVVISGEVAKAAARAMRKVVEAIKVAVMASKATLEAANVSSQ